MNIFDLMVGKKMKVMTDMKVEVELEILKVKENHNSQDLEPATAENDWWPPSREWKTYTVTFVNGSTKDFDSINQMLLS